MRTLVAPGLMWGTALRSMLSGLFGWLRPSLVRRLLVAQLLLMLALWLAFISYLLYLSQHDQSELAQDHRYDMIIAVAESLADQPERQRQVLAELDRFQRQTESIEDEPEMRMNMLVRRHGQLLFLSPGLSPQIRNTVPNTIERVADDRRQWHARTRGSASSGIEVTLVKPANAINMLLIFTSKGFLLLPLLVSLPFLVLPTWLSVWLALRPWRRVTHEIATRGPHELQPLAFQPPHRELRPLVSSLNAWLERVRDSARREREFVADAAHELRTPLAALRLNAEALSAGAPSSAAAPAAQQELLAGVLRSSERASHIVCQLLSLVRADRAPAQPLRLLDLLPLLQDRLALLSALAAARDVELVLEAWQPAFIAGEPESLSSMIDNLIDNAIKYSPAGGEVMLRLAQQGGQVRLSICDRGPGIAPAWRERVFDRFYRAPDQSQSGTGLGLAIVKSVVERHGGQIVLASACKEAGQDAARRQAGLCVSVSFPAVSSLHPSTTVP